MLAFSQGITTPAPGSTLSGSSVTFTWTAQDGATAYWIDAGNVVGGDEYYQSGNLGNVLTALVSGLPTDGSTVYVRWYYYLDSGWQSTDYTYTASGGTSSQGAITSPAPNTTLTGSSVTFAWTAGSGATAYWLDVGSVAGGDDYYQSGNLGNVLTTTVNGLPQDGSTVYATLYSLVGGVWLSNVYTYTAFSQGSGQGAITSPVPSSTLSGSSVTFTWTAQPGATAYWIDAGNVAGGDEYFQSGNLGNVLTTVVSGLPTDGSIVYVRWYYYLGAGWQYIDYTYTAFCEGSGQGAVTSPVPGSTLSGSSVTFTWTAQPGATAYWIDAGNVAGGDEYFQSGNLGNVLTTVVSGLPIDGSTVYVRWYYYLGAGWQYIDYSYMAFSGSSGQGGITSPVPSSTLGGSSVTFTWTAQPGATAYWIDAGTVAGGDQYFQSGNLGNVLTTVVSGLPIDGSTVYVRWYYLLSGGWQHIDYSYTAFSGTSSQAAITSPVPGSVLSGSSVTFTWTAGSGATAYWVDVGSVAGGDQYYQSGNLGNVLTTTVNTLPTNGSMVYVTLYSRVNGSWLSSVYTYTAFSGMAGGVLTTPVPGSTLAGSSVTFAWTAGSGATAYWVDVGSVAGGDQYYQSGNLGNVLTTTVNTLPTNGSMVYVTLYSLVNGNWLSNTYTYTAFTFVVSSGVLTTPAPGSTLAGSTVTFGWTAGSGAAAYWVDVGSVAGGDQYYQSGNLGNVLTTTVNTLPTNGSTIYVTLYSLVNGTWLSNVYSYGTLVTYPGSTFFVAPNGNDSWNGDLSAPNSNGTDGPFASLSRAQLAVEKAAKPATVIVRNGTYYPALTPSTSNSYPGTLVLTSADSGASSGAQVTWQNYPGETPVISGGVPANADPISGAGLQLQWSNSGNLYQAPLPATLSNNAALQPFESLYYNGQRRLRSRVHDNGTSQYPSIGYFMQNGQCVASPSTPAGQQAPTLASCNLGTFLRVANTISPSSTLGQGCPYASGTLNGATVSKCLDRFVYSNTSGGDPIQAWANLNGSYTGTAGNPCSSNANSYPPGDVELTLVDAWSVDILRVNCVDTIDKVVFLLGAAKGGGTVASSDTNYNYLGPTVGHRYMIENTLDAFNDALTPTAAQYGITGIWFLDRHATPWVLNYIANQNENPATDNIVIPQLGGVIPGAPATDYVGGSLISATKLNYVTFQGIIFEVDNFYPNSVGFNNDVNGELSLPQAIDCENCQFVTFSSVTVRHTSASGILAAASAATPACSASTTPSCVVIENSTFYDIGDSGIRVGHTPGSKDTASTVVQGVLAQNNLIQGYSRVFLDGEGIAEGNGNNNQYSYNTISDGYHAAISICKDGCGPVVGGVSVSGNNIGSSYNLISNIMQGLTSDGGAVFYNIGGGASSATGSSISSNVINNVTDSYIIDNPTTAGVTVNGSAYGGEGIYLDGQSADVTVTNNVVYNLSGHAIDLTEGLASAKETQNSFSNNIFAFANLGMFTQEIPWPNGCPSSPIKQVDVTNNIFYFDRLSTSTPSFYVVEGCTDSCGQAYNTYQNFQGNSYWRTDGQFAADNKAFQVISTQALNANNSCKTSPTTFLYFNSLTAPNWQTGGAGVPVAMNEDLAPNATASYQPPFTGTGLATDPPSDYSFPVGQAPPTPFVPANTNLTITNAHSSLSQVGTVPATFPTYVYGSSSNKF